MDKKTKDIYKIIQDMVLFPNPTVCRHYVAASLLDFLEANGEKIDPNLAKYIVNADDEKSQEILKNILHI